MGSLLTESVIDASTNHHDVRDPGFSQPRKDDRDQQVAYSLEPTIQQPLAPNVPARKRDSHRYSSILIDTETKLTLLL